MTEEEINQFTDVMVKKAALGHGWINGKFQWQPGNEAESLRGLIQNVIIDTDLVTSGAIPLWRWLEEE